MYFKDFTDGTQEQLVDELRKKVLAELKEEIRESGNPERFIYETIDDWINRHNFNLSLSEWVDQIDNADI